MKKIGFTILPLLALLLSGCDLLNMGRDNHSSSSSEHIFVPVSHDDNDESSESSEESTEYSESEVQSSNDVSSEDESSSEESSSEEEDNEYYHGPGSFDDEYDEVISLSDPIVYDTWPAEQVNAFCSNIENFAIPDPNLEETKWTFSSGTVGAKQVMIITTPGQRVAEMRTGFKNGNLSIYDDYRASGKTVIELTQTEEETTFKVTIFGEVDPVPTNKTYYKVKNVNDVDEGKYIIVSEYFNVALNGYRELGLDVTYNTIPIERNGLTIPGNVAISAAAFSVHIIEGQYYFTYGDYYLQPRTNTNSIALKKDVFGLNISFSEEGYANLYFSDDNNGQSEAVVRQVAFNSLEDQRRFRFYNETYSTNHGETAKVCLYKLGI